MFDLLFIQISNVVMDEKPKRKYNYFYKITNNINGFYYYGVHSTDNLEDGYMGSGSRLRIAYKEFGIENFSKEILKFFDTKEEAFEYEASVVTEQLVLSEKCYNQKIGGGESTVGMVTVRDKSGNTFNVYQNDPRYISGELVGVTKGNCVAKDKLGNILYVSCDDPRFKTGEIFPRGKGMICATDKSGNNLYVSCNDPRFKTGEIFSFSKGKAVVRDRSGKYYFVDNDDERISNGELVHTFKDRKHSEETKRKIGEKNSIHQTGSGNSQYGTCWIKNDLLKVTKRIKTSELEDYISDGWKRGRCMKYSRDIS